MMTDKLKVYLESGSKRLNSPLKLYNAKHAINLDNMNTVLDILKRLGAQVIVVVLYDDISDKLILAADTRFLPLQCVAWSYLSEGRSLESLATSVMIEMHYKLGGVACCLVPRGIIKTNPDDHEVPVKTIFFDHNDEGDAFAFQKVPGSLPWIFDQPCMVIGIDISRPEAGRSEPSVVGVVASMDSYLGQYGAYMYCQQENDNNMNMKNLEQATVDLLDAFSRRNDWLCPRRVIIYRSDDTVHLDSCAEKLRFRQLLQSEVKAIQEALYVYGEENFRGLYTRPTMLILLLDSALTVVTP